MGGKGILAEGLVSAGTSASDSARTAQGCGQSEKKSQGPSLATPHVFKHLILEVGGTSVPLFTDEACETQRLSTIPQVAQMAGDGTGRLQSHVPNYQTPLPLKEEGRMRQGPIQSLALNSYLMSKQVDE